MSGPLGSQQWMYNAGREFYDFPIDQSLRFEDGDTAYLSRTPASAGNRKTWTWSGWVKKSFSSTTDTVLFSANNGGNQWFLIGFSGGNAGIDVDWYNGSTRLARKFSNAVYRDVSAWYNVVVAVDTTDATAEDRIKVYINGVRITSWSINTNPSQNSDTYINSTNLHTVGKNASTSQSNYFDGYMAEVNFIDGQALDATSFGELKSGIWTPVDTAGLTFGTNGFRLQFDDTTEASGFNAVTYTGNGSSQSVSGVGFSSSPDFVWIKERSSTSSHILVNSVIGATKLLSSNTTDAEQTDANKVASLDTDGFSLGSSGAVNQSSQTYVAWAWDAGSGSAASNTDGSITSTVKANTDYGFSIASFTGASTQGATFGHGLATAPNMVIAKARTAAQNWWVYHSSLGYTKNTPLNLTNASATDNNTWLAEPTSSLVTIGDNFTSSNNYIAYCFAEKTGYSKFGTYTGTGAAGNSITGLGFKPAFLLARRTDSASNWGMWDNTRDTEGTITKYLLAELANVEGDASSVGVDFDDDGFTFQGGSALGNVSGGTFIYMAFADTRDAAFWRDTSGQGNDWQPNNLTFSDVVPDAPSNNFGGWMSEAGNESSGFTYSEGNKKIVAGSSDYGAYGNFFTPKSGKWYWEYCNTAVSAVPSYKLLGIASASIVSGNDKYDPSIANGVEWGPTGGTAAIYGIRANGDKLSISATTAYGADDYQTSNDIVQVALDMDNLKVWFGINGVWQNSGDPVAGTNAAFTGIAEDYYTCMIHQWYPGQGASVNFGDDGTFHGSITAGGNSDANGYGVFKYTPPSGFLALCSANLPSGAIDTLADETPEDYFNTVLWTGNGTSQSITGVGFQSDLVWTKKRSSTSAHYLVDAVRGSDKVLFGNLTDAEVTTSNVISSLDSDGFSIGADGGINASGQTFVGWNWKAGGSGVANTDGTLSSTVSVGATTQQNWFSIASYTGNATAGATIGHGLGVAPDMIIVKSRDNARDWRVYHSSLGSSYTMDLNTTLAVQGPNSAYWNSTDPTSSVFSVGSVTTVNGSGEDYIAYCFANAEGLCRAGKYTGNGSTDGTFVYTGFRPSFLLVKNTSIINQVWLLLDAKRGSENVISETLEANNSNAESNNDRVDFVSNGFKWRNNYQNQNNSGNNFIYLAIAEQPFKYANAR